MNGEIEVGGHTVKLKNLEKIYEKKDLILKGEVIEYYIKIAPLILPHIKDKPFSMIHFPEGVGGKSFYQKQCPTHKPDWLDTVTLPSSKKGEIDWCVVTDAAGIVYMANRSVIEMHTWFSRLPNLEMPDVAVIDLDPSGATGFKEALIIARTFGELLKELKIFAVPKTTGSRGIHIYIPIKPASFNQVQFFLNKLCEVVLLKHPYLATRERTVNKRGDKIYLDTVQNAAGKTIAAPYSLRAREHLPASTPLSWDELNDNTLTPQHFTIRTLPARLAKTGDLFKNFYSKSQPLPAW